MDKKLSIEQLEAALQELEISTEYIDVANDLSYKLLNLHRNTERAQALAKETYDLCTEQFATYKKGLAEALINLSLNQANQSNVQEALRLILQARIVIEELDDTRVAFKQLTIQRFIYALMDNYSATIGIGIEHMQMAQKHNNVRQEIAAIESLVWDYYNLGAHTQALEYSEKAWILAEQLNSDTWQAHIHYYRTYPLRKLGQYDLALQHALKAYSVYKGNGSRRESIVVGILGHIHLEMEDYEKAMTYFQQELEIVETLDSDYLKAYSYCEIGMVHLAMGRLSDAIHWLETGIELAETHAEKLPLLENYPHLIKAYKATNNYELALTTFEKLATLRSEVHSTNATNQRNVLLVTHETEQAKLEAKLQQERAERLRTEADNLTEQNALLAEIDAQKTELIALRTAENYRLAYAINQSVDGVVITDQEGNIQFANPAWATMHGYQPDTLAGRPLSMFFAPAKFDKDHAQFFAQVHKKGTAEGELTHLHHEGRTFPAMMTAALLRDTEGDPSGLVCIGRDITLQKEAEANLKRALRDLQRSNEELKQFAFVTSHDLQEPLRTITSYLQLIQKRYADIIDPSGRTFIQAAVSGAARMKKLMADFLTFSDVETPNFALEETDLNQVLQRARHNLAAALNESEAVLTYDPLPVVMANEAQLTQLLQNLLSNAIKFHKPEEPPQVEVTAKRGDSYWTITVRDHGIGYDPKYSEHIFELFKRLHSRDAYEGTGMGLAICKRIVERHDGHIWSTSTPGEGATFSFTLPIQPQNDKTGKAF